MKQKINSLVTFSNHEIYSAENASPFADKVNLKDFETEFVNWLKHIAICPIVNNYSNI